MKTSHLYIFLLLLQIALMLTGIWFLNDYIIHIYLICQAIGLILSIAIASSYASPTAKISWILAVLLLPIVGILMFLVFGIWSQDFIRVKKMKRIIENSMKYENNEHIFEDKISSAYEKQMKYIQKATGRPVYKNFNAKYLKSGEEKFKYMIDILKNAKKFIHLEYYIISTGNLWDEIEAILIEKADNGVEVRILYDYMGSLNFIDRKFKKRLYEHDIKISPFNAAIPAIHRSINYRNHRKIAIIDGIIGFMGGINIGDEYVNRTHPFGYWKDAQIMVTGECVRSLSTIFLNDWVYSTNEKVDYLKYMPMVSIKGDQDGWIQFFENIPDTPENPVMKNAYFNAIVNTNEYIYIATPYLVPEQDIITALCVAAKGGVRVVIVIPGIPDKNSIYIVSRSFYDQLLVCGVEIYEYTPGFIHSKMLVSDDKVAMVGTPNLDLRSFYLNFEVAALCIDSSFVTDIKADFEEIIKQSKRVDIKVHAKRSFLRRIEEVILRLFAPMM